MDEQQVDVLLEVCHADGKVFQIITPMLLCNVSTSFARFIVGIQIINRTMERSLTKVGFANRNNQK